MDDRLILKALEIALDAQEVITAGGQDAEDLVFRTFARVVERIQSYKGALPPIGVLIE